MFQMLFLNACWLPKLSDTIIHHQGGGWQFCQIQLQGIEEWHCGIEFSHWKLLWQQRRKEKKTGERGGVRKTQECVSQSQQMERGKGLSCHGCPIKSKSLPAASCKPGLVKDRWKTYCSHHRMAISVGKTHTHTHSCTQLSTKSQRQHVYSRSG